MRGPEPWLARACRCATLVTQMEIDRLNGTCEQRCMLRPKGRAHGKQGPLRPAWGRELPPTAVRASAVLSKSSDPLYVDCIGLCRLLSGAMS